MVTNNKTIVDYGLSIADAAGAIYHMTTTGLGGEFVTWKTTCDEPAGGDTKACDPKDAIHTADGRFRLRPEVLETWYYAYRATRDTKYREWSWAAFEAINQYCRTESGFSGIRNVNAEDGGGKSDEQESFIFAEVMKYVYLMHLEVSLSSLTAAKSGFWTLGLTINYIPQDRGMPYHVQDSRTGVKNTWVFNTEAHQFQVAGPPV